MLPSIISGGTASTPMPWQCILQTLPVIIQAGCEFQRHSCVSCWPPVTFPSSAVCPVLPSSPPTGSSKFKLAQVVGGWGGGCFVRCVPLSQPFGPKSSDGCWPPYRFTAKSESAYHPGPLARAKFFKIQKGQHPSSLTLRGNRGGGQVCKFQRPSVPGGPSWLPFLSPLTQPPFPTVCQRSGFGWGLVPFHWFLNLPLPHTCIPLPYPSAKWWCAREGGVLRRLSHLPSKKKIAIVRKGKLFAKSFQY